MEKEELEERLPTYGEKGCVEGKQKEKNWDAWKESVCFPWHGTEKESYWGS